MRLGTVLFVGALILAAFPGVAPAGEAPPPCSDPAYRQFDFWLGSWEVTTPDGQLAGHNRIEKILGGCVLRESWRGARGLDGHSYNTYDPARGVWHQTWVDGNGTLLLLEGGLQGDSMVLTGKQTKRDGNVLNRITWTPLESGTVRQHWEVSTDGGGSWQTIFDGRYQRVEDVSPEPEA